MGISSLKQIKWTPPLNSALFKLVLVPNFSFNFLNKIFPKRVFPDKNRKSEHHHGILDIQTSTFTKFQLKLIILCFDQIYQKGHLQSKTEQTFQGLQVFDFSAVNVNSTVAFEHFKDLKNIIVFNILKEKLVVSCLLGSFYLKIV